MRRPALLIATFLLAVTLGPPPAAAEEDAETLCATPRRAVQTWVDNLQTNNLRPSLSILCFDWSRGPEGLEARHRVARELLAVLDGQGRFIVYEDIPADAEYEDEDSGQSRYQLFSALPELYVERADGQWRVSAATVAATDGLFRSTYRIPLQRIAQQLPEPMRGTVLGVKIWQWLALVLLIFGSVVLGRLAELLLVGIQRKAIRKFFEDWDSDFEKAVTRRAGLLVAAGAASLLLPNIGLPVRFNQFLFIVLKVLASVAAVLIGLAIVDLLFDAWKRVAAGTETKMDDQVIPLLRRTAEVLVWLIGSLFVLQNLDVDVGSLLAGLGLGGLAFALAAKDTLANVFGSLTIFTDRPFQIGDWVVIGGVEGSVEQVGFRSTRVRTFYNSLVSLPNQTVANATIDNMGQRQYRRFKTVLALTYDTTPEQMEEFVAGVRASIEANPRTRKDTFEVHWNSMGPSSLDVLVYAFFEVATWTEELQGRQELMAEWVRLARRIGVEFAFPTQTLHIAGPEGEQPGVVSAGG